MRQHFGNSRRRVRSTRGADAVVWALLPGLALAACTRSGGPDQAKEGAIPAVEAVLARSGTLPLEERLNGVVKSHNQVSIRAEISAPIVQVHVRSGEAVEEGQPLVTLQDDALRDQLRHAEASVRLEEAAANGARARVAELTAQVTRARALAEEALISRLELETLEAQLLGAEAAADQAVARVDQVRATVEERRSAIAKTVIRAPVAGRVGRRNAEVGMLAEPSALLFEVGNLENLIVEVPLTGQMLRHIKEGLPARITAAGRGGQELRARISRISPFLAASTFSTIGEIDVQDPEGRLRPGMFVNVDLMYGESEEATLVPGSALWEDPRTGVRGIFVVDMAGVDTAALTGTRELSAQPRPVALRSVQVLAEGRATLGVEGVRAGEWVVTIGQHLLRDEAEARARVRPVTWERVLELQALQREDLLRAFLEKQQRLARAHGAAPPSNEEFLGGGARKGD